MSSEEETVYVEDTPHRILGNLLIDGPDGQCAYIYAGIEERCQREAVAHTYMDHGGEPTKVEMCAEHAREDVPEPPTTEQTNLVTDGGEEVSVAATEHVLEYIEEKTAAEVDGLQDNQAAVWTGGNHLKAQARKDRIDFDVNELEVAMEELREAGEIITWHGLVALASDEHLETIVQNEAQSDITRGILVGHCNRLLAGEEVTYRAN